MESWILHHPEYTWPNPNPKQSILVILVILIYCMTIAMAIFHLENWIPDVKAHGFRILRFLGRGQYGTAWGSSVNTPRMPDFLLGPGTANFLFYWCDACSMHVIICNIQYIYIYVIHWLFAIYWYDISRFDLRIYLVEPMFLHNVSGAWIKRHASKIELTPQNYIIWYDRYDVSYIM